MKFRISSGVVSTVVDAEVTVLDPRTGLYFGLEHVAARVWGLLEEGRTVSELVTELQREFDVDETTCRTEVHELLEDLQQRGLVQPG